MSRSTSRCRKCGIRKPKADFEFVHEVKNPFHAKSVKCQFCRECQLIRSAEPNHRYRHYVARNKLLKHLGFESYEAYLASDLWKSIRERVMKKDGFKCRICGDRAVLVHHNLYRRRELLGQSIKGMRSLCSRCHKDIEFSDGAKVSLPEASNRYVERDDKCVSLKRNTTSSSGRVCDRSSTASPSR